MSRQNKVIWAVLAGIVVVAALVLPLLLTDDTGNFWEGMLGLLMLAGLGLFYLLPTIIAAARKHHNLGAIIAVNILLGWSVIGWIVALVWSLTDPSPTVRVQQFQTAPAQYQVGDVVNGYRFNGQEWTPLQ